MSETVLERWKRTKPHFTCPRCDATSWNPNDIAERYCGRCHVFFTPPAAWPLPRPQLAAVAPMPRKRRIEPARPSESKALAARHDDDVSDPFPSFPSFSSDPDPAPSAAPDIDPGGGSSGGGGASGDW